MAYLCIGSAISSLSFFSPTIVAGLGYTDLDAQLYSVPPYAAAYVVTMFAGWLSDRCKDRGLVAGTAFMVATVSFIISGTPSKPNSLDSSPFIIIAEADNLCAVAAIPGEAFQARYALLCISTCGVFGGLPSLLAWVGDNCRTTTAGAIATALNIAFSGPGQIIGVWIFRSQDAPFYRLGHGINAGMSFLAALCAFSLAVYYRRLNSKLVGTNEVRWVK
ncbi:hypothetical protein IMZ48_39615 [Candidatus Bathyarchaeota archaeon]|nr:hypothetical protein [Candidatus Bathyarchaeota archaeon]